MGGTGAQRMVCIIWGNYRRLRRRRGKVAIGGGCGVNREFYSSQYLL